MVGGAKCHDPIGTWPCRAANGCGATHELECAYVSRFGRWLQQSYGCMGTNATGPEAAKQSENAVAYYNRAQGGTTTISSLPHLPYVVGLAGGPNQDGPADLLVVDYTVNDMFEVRGPGGAVAAEIAAATEGMLRYLLRAYPATAILLVDACCLPPGKRNTAAKRRVAEAYGVPLVAYGDALAVGGCDGAAWTPAP